MNSEKSIGLFEPPDEVIMQGKEPWDKPVHCREMQLYLVMYVVTGLALLIHWNGLRIAAVIIDPPIICLALFRLCVPPRFSATRLVACINILSYLYYMHGSSFHVW